MQTLACNLFLDLHFNAGPFEYSLHVVFTSNGAKASVSTTEIVTVKVQ